MDKPSSKKAQMSKIGPKPWESTEHVLSLLTRVWLDRPAKLGSISHIVLAEKDGAIKLAGVGS